jgi:hypothetical protein
MAEMISYLFQRESLGHQMSRASMPQTVRTAMPAVDVQSADAGFNHVVQGTGRESAKWRL